MSEQELKSFRQDLQRDPELVEELDLHRLIEGSIKSGNEGVFRKKLEASYKRIITNSEEKSSRPGLKPAGRYFLFYSLTAVFLVGLFLLINLNRPDEDLLFESYYVPATADFGSRSAGISSEETNLTAGIEAYHNENYELSRANLEAYLGIDPEETILANYYMGLTSLELGDYMEAKKHFRIVIESPFSYYQEHSRWYLALALLKESDFEEAEKLFYEISREQSAYSERSAKILKKIQRIK